MDLERVEQYRYLVKLRNSGATNMWGAVPYLEDHLGLERSDAKAVLLDWIQSFDLPDAEQPDDGRNN